MIVWLASYPRSGNTYFRILLNRMFGLCNYSVYDTGLSQEQIRMLPTARMVGEAPIEGSLNSLAQEPKLFIIKTHELPADDTYATIYIVRDGRDALVSYAHFIIAYKGKGEREIYLQEYSTPSEGISHAEQERGNRKRIKSFREILQDLIAHEESFGGWGRHVLAWTRREAVTVVVKFEELLKNPAEKVKESVDALGLRMSKIKTNELPDFEKLHEVLPQFFREGKIGGWRTEMPDDLHDLFWKKNGALMESLGYQR